MLLNKKVPSHFSSKTMLQQLNLPLLWERRKQARVTNLYKVANKGLKLMLVTNLYHQIDYLDNPMFTHSKNNIARAENIESFYPRTIRDWNNLSAPVTSAQSLTRSRDFCMYGTINFRSDVLSMLAPTNTVT